MKKLLLSLSFLVSSQLLFAQGIINDGAYLVISNGTTVYVDGGTSGKYTSSGTSYIKNTSGISTLALEGDFTNNSSTNAIDGIAYLKIQLTGGIQAISGSKSSILGTIESAGTGAKTISTKQQISELILNGQDVSLSDTIRVLGKLTLTSGALTTAGKLILTSTADSTAKLTAISNGSISGNAIVERYIPGGTDKRRWRYLSSPVNTDGTNSTLEQYIDDIFVTGANGIAGGFDNCSGCAPSIRTYDESVSGNSSNGWTNPTNISNANAKGTGVEVFVRGSRNLANPYLNWTIPDNVTIDFIGALNTGSIVKSISYTNSNTVNSDGFNLVGNPYPSPIDWAAQSGWTRTNISPWMYIYSAKTSSYNYINSDGVTLIGSDVDKSTIVPSGQAFFVKATNTGASITFTESVKVSSTPFNFFRGLSYKPVLKYSLSFNNEKYDEALIGFNDTTNSHSRDISEAVKFYNDKINLYSISSDGAAMAIDYRPLPTNTDSIRIAVWDYDSTNVEIGTHKLKFDSLNTISNMGLFLVDKFTSITTDLRNQNIYNFNITTDANSYGNNRFLLVFDATTGISNSLKNNIINIYPNPATNVLNIGISDAKFINEPATISIKNIVGEELLYLENNSFKNLENIDITSLSEGVYFLTVKLNGLNVTKKFIK